ncbi:MAG: FecR family protein [Oscillospiraceae bacterium]|nr:FecR family protein [Oscillospiraceae bacterium]
MKFIHENLKIIIIAIAALIAVILAAVTLSLAFGGETLRSLTISDIQGTVVIIRGEKQFYAGRKTVLQSGDVVNTDENSTVRIRIDADKYIAIEPESAVYVYYTGVSDKGDVSVNIAKGAVTCQLNKPLKKSETFQVKTPNTAINVRGTVFRTEFEFADKYMGYENVMLTHVQNFDGSVMLQLYGTDGEKNGEPMLLTERTGAELVSCDDFSQYGYLNYDINMYGLKEITLKELIRICGEHTLAYTPDELNSAFRAVSSKNAEQTAVTAPPQTEETESTETVTASGVTETTSETAAPPRTEESSGTSAETTVRTAGTTMETHIYTTFPGPKWWEMPNENPYDDDIDDYDDNELYGYDDDENDDEDYDEDAPETVTAQP